jgi:hypothetical protein
LVESILINKLIFFFFFGEKWRVEKEEYFQKKIIRIKVRVAFKRVVVFISSSNNNRFRIKVSIRIIKIRINKVVEMF